MKKLKRFFKELRMARGEIFKILAYGLTIVWYGYALRIIVAADISLFSAILMLIGGLVLGFFTWIGLQEGFSEDDE
jgi:hypothetical protein